MKSIYLNFSASFVLCYFIFSCSYVKAADIISTALGGKWSDKTTWVGGNVPTLTDNVTITSTVTANGASYSTTSYPMVNLTINSGGKIIREKNSGGLSYLKISGNLTNNGEIIDYYDYFDIELSGNLINNGVLKPRYINLVGENQQLSGTKAIECKQINLNMKDEYASANSNLMFKNCRINSGVSITNKKLKMSNFSLGLLADSIRYDAYYGSVSSSSEIVVPIIFDGNGIFTVDNSLVGGTIYGNVIVKSTSYAFFKDLTVEGNITLDEGAKFSSQVNLQKLRVKGIFTNFANLNKDTVRVRKVKFAPRSMYLYLYGNSNNLGSTGISTVYPTTNGKTIVLKGNYDANVYIQQAENNDKPGGKVLINSEVNISGKLDVYANLEIAQGGILNLLNTALTSPIYVRKEFASIMNQGTMSRYHKVGNSWSYRTFNAEDGIFADYELREWSDRIEGVDISVFNNQNYPGLPGSLKRWWRINPVGTGKVKGYTLKLYYDELMLNGQKEENLKVYRSTDKGKTWDPVSIGINNVLDTIENSISIGKWNIISSLLTDFGDFVISSGDGSVPITSPLKVDMTGSPNFRIGAPNRFTVHLFNQTDFQINSCVVALIKSDELQFKQVEFSLYEEKLILPIDSIGLPSDSALFFYVPYLEGNEQFSFDVIAYGNTIDLKSTKAGVPRFSASGFVDFTINEEIEKTFVNTIKEKYKLTQEEEKQITAIFNTKKTKSELDKQKYGKGVEAFRHVAKYVVKEIADKHPGTKLAFELGNALEIANEIKEPFWKRIVIAIQKDLGFFDKGYMERKDSSPVSCKTITGKMVASKDPNEIIGPIGYGTSNFIAKSGKMNYTILFENKKEATAPAYRIQIVDTLSAVFDPGTVKFGATSHTGPMYNWKMERTGNIIKWDIEGIELPPNVIPPQGEGFVTFSVDLTDELPSGTEIKNAATIVFDMNPAIRTNTWMNVIDSEAPKTVMKPISYAYGDPMLTVTCNTTDNINGSGTNKYMFFVSINSNPFTLIEESFKNSIQYPVSSIGTNIYRFYALATDNVDNVEMKVPNIVEIKSAPVSSKQIDQIVRHLEFYPNPTSGLVSFELITEIQTLVEIHIYSTTGKLLKVKTAERLSAWKHQIDLDISDLTQGIYFAKVKYENMEETYKLIRK